MHLILALMIVACHACAIGLVSCNQKHSKDTKGSHGKFLFPHYLVKSSGESRMNGNFNTFDGALCAYGIFLTIISTQISTL